jgi:hypothetical protein
MSSIGGSEFLILAIPFGLIFGAICSAIWRSKGGGPGAGFFIGFFLGIFGLIFVAVATPAGSGTQQAGRNMMRECPFCKSSIRRDASVCPYCQRESKPWRLHNGYWWFTNDDGEQFWLDTKSNTWVAAEATQPQAGQPQNVEVGDGG